jgi:hypothetical protein
MLNSLRAAASGRVRRLFLRDLSGSPGPNPPPGVKLYRAPLYWKLNVCGAAVAGIAATGLLAIIGAVVIWSSPSSNGRIWGVGMILCGAAAFWASLTGNLGAMFPYAAEVEESKGVRLYGAFQQLYIPTSEIKSVTWSWLWAAWLVEFRHRRGLLRGFVIHSAWRQQGRELAQAIQEETRNSGEAT